MYSQTEKQRYDGWYNNLAHPDWGSVGRCNIEYDIIRILSKYVNATTF